MSDLQTKINNIPEWAFYAELDEATGYNDTDLSEYVRGCNTCTWDSSIKSYILKIIYNFDKLKHYFNKPSYSTYCRYLKYWVYSEKKNYEIRHSNEKTFWNNCIPCIWKNLQTKNINSHGTCELDYDNFSNAIISMKRELDMFCAIKKHLGNTEELKTNKEYCMAFNQRKDYYVNLILKYLSSIPNKTYLEPKFFDIDDACSLKNIDTIFSDINCSIEEDCKSCPVQDCSSAIDEALSSASPSCICEPFPEQSATEDLTYNSSYEVPLSICITFFVTIVICFLLYKHTPFGHWLHNSLRSRYLLRKNMDNENTQELLEINSRYSDSIENREYNITYENF
ncbi:PIR Superfamily Protein [Plasmodium ovale wallikeri]|uniref:PIR Superfamily Protein n=1 Tax=Plasmodium ovale wallikeri TaxID=864142 RepID=A0A1A9AKE9_PLAOA|nr:PIR Superfamily Protein [Plasmodium ovale wallikeri]SBT56666.1 PIR Superfamily Protein [Plasmodium ovale wallikeri]